MTVEQKSFKRMLHRMESVFTDHSYINEVRIVELSTFKKRVNRHAVTLVLKVTNQLYEILLNYGAKILAGDLPFNN